MKRKIMIVPHALYLILLIWAVMLFIDLPHGDYGLIIPAIIFIFAPLPSAISAVGLMIVNVKSKTEKSKGIPIAYGIIGCILLILYALMLLFISLQLYDGPAELIFAAAIYFAPFCLIAIWVLWIINTVKSRKRKGGFKYIPKK